MRPIFILIALLTASHGFCQQRQSFTLLFDFDRYELTLAGTRQLDSLLSMQPGYFDRAEIELSGHCDFTGSEKYNDWLSLKRVSTVKNYLVNRGVPDTVIRLVNHYGERQPLNDNSTDAERQMNRRVEVVVIEKNAGYPAQPGTRTDTLTLQELIADTAIQSGANIALKNINFYGGLHHFLPGSKPQLEELLQAMKTYPRLVIEVQGHICCESHPGDGLDNETGLRNLSEARARAVRQYLIDNGIDGSRVSYRGFGHSRPIHPYPEQNEQQMIENRRVEIRIMSK